ncbi:MAG: ATP-binding cassette domain-containing protein [Pseudomonadota bacterium]
MEQVSEPLAAPEIAQSQACRIDRLVVDVAAHFRLECSDISIPSGARVALVGANGAGKSTLIEALVGTRRASVEEVQILGRSLADQRRDSALRARLGVQLQNVFYPKDAPVREIARLHDAMYGGDVTAAGEMLDIARLARRPFGQLSQGERQRVHLYVALAHGADIIFLDEPGTALDRKYVRRVYGDWLGGLGATVLMATHDAAALEACTHTLWLSRGKVKRFGRTQNMLEDLLGRFRLEVTPANGDDPQKWDVWLQQSLKPKRIQRRQDSMVLYCDVRPSEAVQQKLHEEAAGFALATTNHKDLLSLTAEGE